MLKNILCEVRCLGYRTWNFHQNVKGVERGINNKPYFSNIYHKENHSFKVHLPTTCVTEGPRIHDKSHSYEINYCHETLKGLNPVNNTRNAETCITSHRYLKSTRNIPSVWKPVQSESLLSLVSQLGFTTGARSMTTGKDKFTSIRNRISSLHARKRQPKKKKVSDMDSEEDWQVTAYATADEYDLDGLLEGLTQQGLYTVAAINPGNVFEDSPVHGTSGKAAKGSAQQASYNFSAKHQSVAFTGSSALQNSSTAVPDAHDVLHMVATYRVGSENREIYFFREGSAVFWNITELECANVLLFLKKYEKGSYKKDVIEEESEVLTYTYSDTASKTRLVRNRIVLNPEGVTDLEKYTFSNAMAMSVKLGIWESSLDKYIDDIEYVSEELSKTGRVVLSQEQVLQCMGQLCALRHLINLSSDLLDTPDFYWEHENLELLYQKTSNYLNISKRTSVMNVKLSHCVELMELLKSHLHERHSARLEWIIIILIMIEVGFEVLHVAERWL
ncbi:required for meiotic nuclear division protein 1 homolog isoform X2 [Palaemon carinicauda]|uniref:required for meiotic nuclear division protein 1 homolog isoform X2 n=1 Tax=Palaemon carinicauda TaxID=392227 RepID=UPI0035B641E2